MKFDAILYIALTLRRLTNER